MSNIDTKIVIGAGFGSSGLSALMDLLDEVEDIYVTPQEFAMFNDPDGLISLESALVDNWSVFQGNVAIRRFIKLSKVLSKKYASPYPGLDYTRFFGNEFTDVVNKYVNNITNLTFIGLSYGVDTLLKRQLNLRVPFFRRSKLTNDTMYLAKNLTEEKFISYTREFVQELANLCLTRYKKSTFVFDEGFASLSLNKVLRYLPENAKVITVIRDPRDVYSELKAMNDAWMFQPNEVESFIKYQKAMFVRWESEKRQAPKDQFLELKFDRLVTNYKDSVNSIFEFLGIDPIKHTKPLTKLDPSVSKKNVGRWKKDLSENEKMIMNSSLNDLLKKYDWQ
jgi:hypothetical protein